MKTKPVVKRSALIRALEAAFWLGASSADHNMYNLASGMSYDPSENIDLDQQCGLMVNTTLSNLGLLGIEP